MTPGRALELTAADGHRLAAYRRSPAGPPKGGLVVVQEIFGVNGHIRRVADRFAEAGYDVVAPALFDRQERGVELPYDDAGFAKGRALAAKLDDQELKDDLGAAIAEVAAAGRVGAVGYCMGGAVVWRAAAGVPGLAGVVSYYGSAIPRLLDRAPRVPLMMHVGKEDPSFPMEAVAEVGARYPAVIIHAYDAGHGFNCDERPQFDAAASALALERTLAFFAQHLGA